MRVLFTNVEFEMTTRAVLERMMIVELEVTTVEST